MSCARSWNWWDLDDVPIITHLTLTLNRFSRIGQWQFHWRNQNGEDDQCHCYCFDWQYIVQYDFKRFHFCGAETAENSPTIRARREPTFQLIRSKNTSNFFWDYETFDWKLQWRCCTKHILINNPSTIFNRWLVVVVGLINDHLSNECSIWFDEFLKQKRTELDPIVKWCKKNPLNWKSSSQKFSCWNINLNSINNKTTIFHLILSVAYLYIVWQLASVTMIYLEVTFYLLHTSFRSPFLSHNELTKYPNGTKKKTRAHWK